MKRYIALVLALLTFVLCFAGCKKKIEGEPFLTEENGDLMRGDGGAVPEYVTDENGKILKDKDGNPLTSMNVLQTAYIHDNTIEYRYFSVELPDDWQPASSMYEINFKSDDGKKDVCVYTKDDFDPKTPAGGLFDKVLEKAQELKAAVTSGKTKLCGVDAVWQRIDLDKPLDNGDGTKTASIIYYTFNAGRAKYGVMCYGYEKDIKNEEFEKIIDLFKTY